MRLEFLLLIAFVACASASVDGTLRLEVGDTIKGFLGEGSHQLFVTDLSDDSGVVESDLYFLSYLLESSAPNICVAITPPNRGIPTPTHYLRINCTNEDLLTITLRMPSHMFEPGEWTVGVFSGPQAVYALTAMNTTTPGLGRCPPLKAGAIAGPYSWKNYCWYLSLEGATCDATCHALGGANLIDYAMTVFTHPTECPSSCPGEPVDYFHQTVNPYSWSGVGTSDYRSLGYGETGAQAACHCGARNPTTGGGGLIHDHNDSRQRAVVCSCFRTT